MNEVLVGWAALGIPLLVIGLVPFGRSRAVAFFYIAMLILGLGYLTTTGAVRDIGREALVYVDKIAPRDAPVAATPAAPATPPANPITTVDEAPPAAPAPAP